MALEIPLPTNWTTTLWTSPLSTNPPSPYRYMMRYSSEHWWPCPRHHIMTTARRAVHVVYISDMLSDDDTPVICIRPRGTTWSWYTRCRLLPPLLPSPQGAQGRLSPNCNSIPEMVRYRRPRNEEKYTHIYIYTLGQSLVIYVLHWQSTHVFWGV